MYAKRLHWQSCHQGGSYLFMKYDVFRQNAEFFLGIKLISFNFFLKWSLCIEQYDIINYVDGRFRSFSLWINKNIEQFCAFWYIYFNRKLCLKIFIFYIGHLLKISLDYFCPPPPNIYNADTKSCLEIYVMSYKIVKTIYHVWFHYSEFTWSC